MDNQGFTEDQGGDQGAVAFEDIHLNNSGAEAVTSQEPRPAEEPDYQCGWWLVRPRCLQKYRTAKWVLFGLCWAGAIQGLVVNGLVNVVITTIEQRFGLRSSQSGLIAGGYDIASFICLIPVTYFGGRVGASKPRWLGIGVALLGLGSFTFAVPHFLVSTYRGSTNSSSVCAGMANSTLCEDSEQNLSHFRWVFFVAQLLHGAGSSPLYTLGVAFMDESVSTKMSSVYLGIFFTMSVVGPALGYVVGGQLLGIYTDFLVVDPSEVGLTPASSAWIGAWWIGFVVSALASFMLAIPLIAFPQQLPGAAALQAEKVSEAHGSVKSQAFDSLRDLPRALKDLLSNPTFFFLNLAAASEGLVLSGFSAFLPKFLENQFSIGPRLAALLVGMVSVPAAGGGTYLGGYLVKRFDLHCSGIIKMCVAAVLCAAGFTTAFLLSCPNIAFAGVTQSYDNTSSINLSLNSTCNMDCACSKLMYEPICGANNVIYFSPCFAGCKEEILVDNYKYYSSCSCIDSMANDSVLNDDVPLLSQYQAVNQNCKSSCRKLLPFMVLIFIVMFFSFLSTMPALAATLRCVQDKQRSFALGIQWLKVRFLGTIPAPLIFGLLIDRTCVLWKDTCDDNGACLVFDNSYMSTYMLSLAFIGKAVSLLCFFLAWWFYIPPKNCKDGLQLDSPMSPEDLDHLPPTEMNGHVNYGSSEKY